MLFPILERPPLCSEIGRRAHTEASAQTLTFSLCLWAGESEKRLISPSSFLVILPYHSMKKPLVTFPIGTSPQKSEGSKVGSCEEADF